MTRSELDTLVDERGLEVLVADGFDDCIIGLGCQFTRWFVVYDLARVIETLMTRDGMTREEASEYFDFNIVGAWVGDATPCYVET